MTYDEFKSSFLHALHASRLPVIGFPVERLDLRSLSRTFRVGVEPFGHLETPPFHASAAIEWRWDALHAARTVSTEEDMLAELLGREDAQDVETERPWLRVDITLQASLLWGHPIPMPKTAVWAKWAREVVERLQDIEPLVPEDSVQDDEDGNLRILAWQGEPSVEATCGPDGELKVTAVKLAAWEAIEVPRQWDDSQREDEDPDEHLAAMFERVRASLGAWTEVLTHLR